MSLVFDCPGDGTCSSQGTCDGTTGTCVCFEGFERSSGICKGNFSYCFKIIWIHLVQYYLYFLLDVSCPGVGSPCSGNGQCDLTVGVCTCQEGFQGSDCFGKITLEYINSFLPWSTTGL